MTKTGTREGDVGAVLAKRKGKCSFLSINGKINAFRAREGEKHSHEVGMGEKNQ